MGLRKFSKVLSTKITLATKIQIFLNKLTLWKAKEKKQHLESKINIIYSNYKTKL